MDITEDTTHRNGLVRALAKLKWPTRPAGRREVAVAATVLVVLALAAWAMISFHADRLSPLPRTGNPMPTLPLLKQIRPWRQNWSLSPPP